MIINNFSERCRCFNFEKGNEGSIEFFEFEEDVKGEFVLNHNILFYALKGTAEFSYDPFDNVILEKEQLFFIPIGKEVEFSILSKTECLIFRLDDEIDLCDCPDDEMSLNAMSAEKELCRVPYIIKNNTIINNFMDNILFLIKQNLFYSVFFELKAQELLLILKAALPKKELISLFYLYMHEDPTFLGTVIRNHKKYDTMAKLAESMHYTVSGFEKRFKKTFGISPAKWLRQRKAKDVYRDVCFGDMNFKEIADKYDFSSTSTFNDFFKFTFGETPGRMRKKINSGRF